MILAVDTSLGSTVAIVEPDGAVRAVARSENTLGHAEVIGTLLQRALADAGVSPADVTHVAAGMGPGAFTGLRIGIAAARAFALGRGIPVVPVPGHVAAALAHLDAGATAPFAVVTDARRRENAVTVFDGRDANGLPRRVAGPELRANDVDLAADPLLSVAAGPASDGARGGARTAEVVPVTEIPADALGRVAASMLASGWAPTGELAETEPLYLRSPDVTVGHAPKKVRA
ncbi:tRNA (adenosine(37)-N6)-threonylcarbamoyltransferase complex dimerization subunit type 1 TsaB [Microbacterium marinilacus]|uniref:tRNA (Adenosine(37)-N6)-threonylcarbamoyltransferase complex dimerization subunit type 1 TsaB n=1 Tax=Microbacterium marinilacus TaxID=415209 RepID=A0ABP7BEP4_9MICO|nr:tRNA (adenosine(37)-N6)-threonylcarbamoyltransferase complex dimerization subunit type 1 TsaB [Microbacterium marinilacus]MBY0689397.1 tRNA (adenosine(37)-N6)-threonylcarbamoyltransferase complex dimerization subunit type 1 TsaB [Microbacterium marinilacus]